MNLGEGSRNFGHLAYRVDNIYETCQRLMDMGYTINRPPRDGHMAFVRSPDKISIEILQEGNLEPKNHGLQWKIPAPGKSMKKKILRLITKKNKSKIVSLTAYSKNIATILDNFCDIILVGDSLGSVLYNYKSTREVSLDQ